MGLLWIRAGSVLAQKGGATHQAKEIIKQTEIVTNSDIIAETTLGPSS
jgi:hypothetical protein